MLLLDIGKMRSKNWLRFTEYLLTTKYDLRTNYKLLFSITYDLFK